MSRLSTIGFLILTKQNERDLIVQYKRLFSSVNTGNSVSPKAEVNIILIIK